MNCTFWLLLTLVNCGNFAAETINYIVDVVTKNLSTTKETEVFMNFTPHPTFISINLSKDVPTFCVPAIHDNCLSIFVHSNFVL